MRYGVSCMGCCRALMTPLFVAGMMSTIALVAGGVVIPIGR
jgi:predicted metal-binding membrane protein